MDVQLLLSDIRGTVEDIKCFSESQSIVDDQMELNRQRTTALALAARICEISEVCVLVINAGFLNEAKSLFRVFLDAYFVFGSICSDAKNVQKYFSTDAAARLKLLNVSNNQNSEIFELVKTQFPAEEKKDLEQEIKEKKIQEFKSFDFANLCDCNHVFNSIYRVCSASVHSTPRSLEPYLSIDNDRIIGVVFNPSSEGIDLVAYDLASFLIKVFSGLTGVFGLLDQEKIAHKNERLSVIASQM